MPWHSAWDWIASGSATPSAKRAISPASAKPYYHLLRAWRRTGRRTAIASSKRAVLMPACAFGTTTKRRCCAPSNAMVCPPGLWSGSLAWNRSTAGTPATTALRTRSLRWHLTSPPITPKLRRELPISAQNSRPTWPLPHAPKPTHWHCAAAMPVPWGGRNSCRPAGPSMRSTLMAMVVSTYLTVKPT